MDNNGKFEFSDVAVKPINKGVAGDKDVAKTPELSDGRQRHTDFINICHNLVDSYPDGLAHGLQKDAIQNAVDARISKKKPVVVEFKLATNAKGKFLTITDKNTKGLQGRAASSVDSSAMEAELKKADADWLRFESFAVTKTDPDAIGARGQGKFVMLCSSKEYKMFYDTLRQDGVYRLGGTQATHTGSPIWPDKGVWEHEVATRELARHCGLESLTEIGTRVIIVNPKPEVLDDIQNGVFERAIKETWFRSIQKCQLEIYLNIDGSSKKIELDDDFMIEKKSVDVKSWLSGVDAEDEIQAEGEKFKIKKLEIFYVPDKEFGEEWAGVSIIHNGMKICSINDGLPDDKKIHITGFIEFDTPLDNELRKGKNQHPNHYDLKWRHAIPRAIRAYLKDNLKKFGREKLGLAEDSRARKKQEQEDAETWAMKELMNHAKDLGLFGARGGSKKPVDIPLPPPPPNKEIGIRLGVNFPDSNNPPRVNWGERISFSLSAFNKTNEDVVCSVSLRIHHHDTEIDTLIGNKEIVIPFDDIEFPVKGQKSDLLIDQTQFKWKGEYRIKAQLNDADGKKIDANTKKIWVEEDQPSRNNYPFELIASSLDKPLAWQTSGLLGRDPKLYYSLVHPEYRHIESDSNALQEYILKICLEGAVHFLLQASVDDESGHENLDKPLDTKKIREGINNGYPDTIYEETMRCISELRWRIYGNGDD